MGLMKPSLLLFTLLMASNALAQTTRQAFDHRWIAQTQGVELVVSAPLTPPEALTLDGDQLWTRNNVHAAIQHVGDEWFGWRYALEPVEGATDSRRVYRMTSTDGKTWTTVSGGLPMMGAILRDDADHDSERRYKAIRQGWAELDAEGQPLRVLNKGQWVLEGGQEDSEGRFHRGIFSAVSADAETWTNYRVVVLESIPEGQRWWRPSQDGWSGGDNFPNLIWAPERNQWVCYFRTNLDRGPKRRERAVGWSASADFETWEPHQLALHARTDWQAAMGYGKQDYYQLQPWQKGDVWLGALSVYDWEKDRVHLELAWSPDTLHWERIAKGHDLVPHGDLGPEGNGSRYAAMGTCEVGGETWFFYGADNGRHNADKDRAGGLWLARFPKDRLVGWKAGSGGGVIRTKVLNLSGGPIAFEADGDVSLKVVGMNGNLLDVNDIPQEKATLEITLYSGTLYSLTY